MNRLLGIIILVAALYGALLATSDGARSANSIRSIANLHGSYGILTLGVGLLIICGGIDLSIGSVVGLSAVGFFVLMKNGVPPVFAVVGVLAGGAVIGLIHALLVTKLKLQPFLVTLCGLFMYRGLARILSDQDIGFISIHRPEFADTIADMKWLLIGKWKGEEFFSAQFILFVVIAGMLGVFLHRSVYGRYMYAIGYNEAAARYAGIRTDRIKTFAYVTCSMLAALVGILFALDIDSISPSSAGDKYELFAITGAVLGGCSLRGGEGTILGMVLGPVVIPLLGKLTTFWGIPDSFEHSIVGMTLLMGTIADEFFRRRAEKAMRAKPT